ncbi:MAG: hypothetical protein AVDCRST_MAG96-2854 [uncultured Segetibacter sp.]|uniref:Uncharacterized protein n=1 Tax=uncultured Segetibacter sp. TaxID=481133 RepID=A0A6J4TC68_9BACT|nr:MAG: hypothetical protein AVDCRST_MAG96-2854 [uncultured Segetibacter sp.]
MLVFLAAVPLQCFITCNRSAGTMSNTIKPKDLAWLLIITANSG